MTKHPESDRSGPRSVDHRSSHLSPAKSWCRVHVRLFILSIIHPATALRLPSSPSFAMSQMPLLAPIYLPGQEPVPPGTTPEERQEMQQMVKYGKYASYAMESCPVKVVMSGGAGESSASWRLDIAPTAADDGEPSPRIRSRSLLFPHVGYIRI